MKYIQSINKTISQLPLWGIFLLALLVRLAFNINIFFDETLAMQSDSGSYLQPAGEILATGGYDTVLRTPGYPLFISFIWLITPGAAIISVIIAQIIMDSFHVITIARIKGFWVSSDALYKSGALLYAINPLAIFYSGKIMSETLFVFFLILSFFFLHKIIKAEHNRNWKMIALTAVSSVTAVFIRPLGLWFFLLLYLFLIFLSQKEIKLQLAVFMGFMIISTLLWSWRNFEKSGIFTLSTATNYNIYIFGQYSYTTANNISNKEAESLYRPGLENIAEDTNLGWRETGRARELGVKLLKDHPMAFFKTALIGWIKCAFQPGWGVNQINQMVYRGYYSIAEGGDRTNRNFSALADFPLFSRLGQLPFGGVLFWIYGGFYLLGLYIFAFFKWKNIEIRSYRLLFVICFLLFVLIAGPLGFSRFRFPAEVVALV